MNQKMNKNMFFDESIDPVNVSFCKRVGYFFRNSKESLQKNPTQKKREESCFAGTVHDVTEFRNLNRKHQEPLLAAAGRTDFCERTAS